MSKSFSELVEIIEKLRAPNGCPWDREQTHHTMLDNLIEESYEFIEAVKYGNDDDMKEELGDILLQVIFHGIIANEDNRFSVDDIADSIKEKLIRRHPHVFGDTTVANTEEVLKNWEEIKSKESGKEKRKYVTDGIPKELPALMRAQKVQKKASKVGFDWDDLAPVLDKVEEEFAEFRTALENGDKINAKEEFGDILFSLVNVARHSDIQAEDALQEATDKFTKRFNRVEDNFDNPKEMKNKSLEELDKLWDLAKLEEL